MMPEPLVMAAACPSLECDAPCSPSDDACAKCEKQLSEEFKKSFDEVTEFTSHHIQSMKTMACIL